MSQATITILLVEDDREIREIAHAILADEGYRMIEAATGDDAHRLLLTQPDLQVDVLFTDVVMPGRLDGIDLADAVRSLYPRIHVLYATGFADLVRPGRDQELCGPVLRKPYRPAELRRAVMALLDGVE